MVAVISNGTAILGLGNLGALASKPVMEGKAVLFKRFADVDSIDLEVDTEDADEFINCVRYLGPSFGGINLEDIKAPDCFIIEQRLRELMDIPVFHDDQHGTAIIAAAGLINALRAHRPRHEDDEARLQRRRRGRHRLHRADQVDGLCRPKTSSCATPRASSTRAAPKGMNQWKSAHAAKTDARTLAEALDGADVFFGLSAQGRADAEPWCSRWPRTRSSSPWPIPIRRSRRRRSPRSAPTRSWRPAARTIRTRSTTCSASPTSSAARSTCAPRPSTTQMKIAAAEALAALAREDVPDDVAAAYQGNRPKFGPNYIIPVPFDPRLISAIPVAVAKAAMESGVAGRPILDLDDIRAGAVGPPRPDRLDAAAHLRPRAAPAEARRLRRGRGGAGDARRRLLREPEARHRDPGRPRRDRSRRTPATAGVDLNKPGIEIINARLSRRNAVYADYLYERLQRKGFLFRDCQRLINNDRNHFAACMVALGDADAHGHRRHAQLFDGARRRAAASSTPSPAIASSASRSRSAAAAR